MKCDGKIVSKRYVLLGKAYAVCHNVFACLVVQGVVSQLRYVYDDRNKVFLVTQWGPGDDGYWGQMT